MVEANMSLGFPQGWLLLALFIIPYLLSRKNSLEKVTRWLVFGEPLK